MYPFYLEIELVNPVINFLKNKGYHVKKEVRIGFCRADIVGIKKNVVVAVELKLNDWRKAIIQAKNYQLGSDYVYIAFPLKNIYNVIRKTEYKLKNEGIGLLAINEKTNKVKVVIESKKSKKMMGRIHFN